MDKRIIALFHLYGFYECASKLTIGFPVKIPIRHRIKTTYLRLIVYSEIDLFGKFPIVSITIFVSFCTRPERFGTTSRKIQNR